MKAAAAEAGASQKDQDSAYRRGMERYELTDGEWPGIKPLLPNKPRGVPRVNDRRVLNGIMYIGEGIYRGNAVQLDVELR